MSVVEFRHDHRQIIMPLAVLAPSGFDHIKVQALIDTGASVSGVAQSLALPRIGKQAITTARGDHVVPLYTFRLGFYRDDAPLPIVREAALVGIECNAGERFEALIGMDVIGRSRLLIDSDGTGSLTLRFD